MSGKIAQHGPDQAGVVSSITTGVRKPVPAKSQMTGVTSGPKQVETDAVHSDDQPVA